MVEGTAEFLFSSVGYRQAEEGQRDADEQLSGVAQEPDLEKIKANALARERILKVRSRLDEIRLERSAQLAARDTDATGVVRNGLFAWRAIRRSVKQTLTDVTKSASDLREAERDVDVSGVDNEHISSMISEAADGFSSLSGDQAKAEMNQLLSVIAERYQLDQEARQVHPVISKLKSLIESNSPAINIVIGSVFRIAFKGVTHTAGLGGAVLASAVYGAASRGIGEYRAARSELLGAKGWREVLSQFESPKQKLEIMRQMIVDKEALKKYFAGNSSEAFEFFGQYQELLAQCDGIDSDELLQVRVSSVEDVYSQRKREIGSRAWRAAGRGAARAAVFSGIGYIGTHVFSELLHGDIAHAQTADSDPTAQGPSHVEVPTAEPSPESGGDHNVVWRYHGDDPSHSARLEIDSKTGLFREADGQGSLVKIEGDGSTGDTGSTPEQVANIIAKRVAGSYGQEHSLPIDSDQQQQIQDHIAKWLEEHKAGDLENSEFKMGETVRVPASELNAAMQNAGVTGESIKEALGLAETAGGMSDGSMDSEAFPQGTADATPIPSDVGAGGGSTLPSGAGMSPTDQPVSPMPDVDHGVPGNEIQSSPPNVEAPGGPVHVAHPDSEPLRVPEADVNQPDVSQPAAAGASTSGTEAEAKLDHSHVGQVMGIVAGVAAAGLLAWRVKKYLSNRAAEQPEAKKDPTPATEQEVINRIQSLNHFPERYWEYPIESYDDSTSEEILRTCEERLNIEPDNIMFLQCAARAAMCKRDFHSAISYLKRVNIDDLQNPGQKEWHRKLLTFALLQLGLSGCNSEALDLMQVQIPEMSTCETYLLAAEAQRRIDPNSPLVNEYFENAENADIDVVHTSLDSGNFPSLSELRDLRLQGDADRGEDEQDHPSEEDGGEIGPSIVELAKAARGVDSDDVDLPSPDGEAYEATDSEAQSAESEQRRDKKNPEEHSLELTDEQRAFKDSLDSRLQRAFDTVMRGDFPSPDSAKKLQKIIFDSATTPLWFVRRFGLVANECPKDGKNTFRAHSVASDCYWRLFSSPGDVESEEMAFAAQRCLEHSEFAIKYAKTNEDKEKYEQRIGECKKYLGEASQGDGNAPTTLLPPEPVVRAQSNPDSVDASQTDATPSVEALSYSEKEFRDALPDGSREVFDGVLAGNLPDILLGIIDLIATVRRNNVPFSFIKKLAPMVNYAAYVGKDQFAMHMLAADCYERIYQETIGTVSPEEKREAILRCAIHNEVLAQFTGNKDKYWPKAAAAARLYIESGYQDPDLGRIKSILFDSLEAQSRTDEARAFALEIGSDPGAWGGAIPKKALEYIRENEAQQQGS